MRVVAYLSAVALLATVLTVQSTAAAVKPKPKATVAAEPPAKPGSGIETQAKHALILEVETGAVLLAKGADLHALDREYESTPAGWARFALNAFNRKPCEAVAEYLEGLM